MRAMRDIRHLLLDIEGTICPISFVKETLFPYALKALPKVLASKWDDPDFVPYRDAFPEEHKASADILHAHVEELTRRDVKIAYLKNLQGYLWLDGYKAGAYSTPLFADVVPCLRKWKEYGIDAAIYSSGSVFAQKLLFAHIKVDGDAGGKKRIRDATRNEEQDSQPPRKRGRTTRSQTAKVAKDQTPQSKAGVSGANEDGAQKKTVDLSGLIVGWFDTVNAGSKTAAASYEKIAASLQWQPEHVLFLSDNVQEVDATIDAGMKSILVDRPGNQPLSDEDRARLIVVESFDDINLSVEGEDSKVATEAESVTKHPVNGEQAENGMEQDA